MAKSQALTNPLNTYEGIGLLLGQKYSEVKKQDPSFTFKIFEGERDSILIECPALRKQFTPEELLAVGLRILVDDANKFISQHLNQVVTAVPSCFTMPQRQALEKAIIIAGLDSLRLSNSSPLAAMAYGYKGKNETVLVVEIDNKCISTAILEIGDGAFEVLSISGDCYLINFEFNQKIINLCRKFIKQSVCDSHVNRDEIDIIIFVEKASLSQTIRSQILEDFEKSKIHEPYSGMSVALGTALQSGVLAGEVKDVLLLDVLPYSLSLEIVSGDTIKMVPRNTTIPTKISKVFSTTIDGQKYLEAQCLHGDREIASEVISVGTIRIDGIPPSPKGVPKIEVIFDLGADAKLNISANDKKTGKEMSINWS